MTALAFDFSYDAVPVPVPVPVPAPAAPEDGVTAAPAQGRRLYAVRGTVGEPQAAVVAPAPPAPALRALPTPTLDDILGEAWTALSTGVAACPVCHEETMTARWTAGHGLAGGRCASCGSGLE